MTDGFEAHGLGKRYRRRHWALRDVDVAVPGGASPRSSARTAPASRP